MTGATEIANDARSPDPNVGGLALSAAAESRALVAS